MLEGASSANLLALAVARHRATGGRVKREGLRGEPSLSIYCSDAVHNSVIKAAELLGLGAAAVRVTPTDAVGRADLERMEHQLRADVSQGFVPCCIVGSAGTVSIGAIDPLPELRALADRFGAWFHIDAAIGAPAVLSPVLRPLFSGMELADSLAFDLHKWAQVPYDAGGLLVRDPELHRATFAVHADYLSSLSGGITSHESAVFGTLGPQLSRSDRAIKVWTAFSTLGAPRIAEVFERNVRQSQLLAARIERSQSLEVVAPVRLNIVCFRLNADDTTNERLLVALQESGVAIVSPARIQGRFCLRAAICNHRTRDEDIELVVNTLESLARSRT